MRSIWERYYLDANCVIFVVDSVDIGRMEEAKLAYESVCNDSRLVNRPVFTFANKQDLKVETNSYICIVFVIYYFSFLYLVSESFIGSPVLTYIQRFLRVP